MVSKRCDAPKGKEGRQHSERQWAKTPYAIAMYNVPARYPVLGLEEEDQWRSKGEAVMDNTGSAERRSHRCFVVDGMVGRDYVDCPF
ncbi:hypothetical protein U1Q18_032941 [Sarracenia purpurea var. burkii]